MCARRKRRTTMSLEGSMCAREKRRTSMSLEECSMCDDDDPPHTRGCECLCRCLRVLPYSLWSLRSYTENSSGVPGREFPCVGIKDVCVCKNALTASNWPQAVAFLLLLWSRLVTGFFPTAGGPWRRSPRGDGHPPDPLWNSQPISNAWRYCYCQHVFPKPISIPLGSEELSKSSFAGLRNKNN